MLIEEWADPEPLVRSLPEVEHDVPADCAECARLFHQAQAAVLTGDRSRLADVRVYQHRHSATEHTSARAGERRPSRAPEDHEEYTPGQT